MTTCYLGIGSNLGDREKFIKLAIKKIHSLKGTQILKKSKIIETDPVGGPAGQPKFLNAVFKVETNLSPVSLLKKLKEIESELGRPRQHARNAPRTIDLDILFYGNKIINQEELKIPHPKVFEREFVIRPLLEVI